jgi:hypothetical protein
MKLKNNNYKHSFLGFFRYESNHFTLVELVEEEDEEELDEAIITGLCENPE